MSADAVKLSAYFGERDHHHGHRLADEIMDLYARHGIATSVLLRGTEGFGHRHRLETERQLTLSEDLPMVVSAVDTANRVEPLVAELRARLDSGLLTLEHPLAHATVQGVGASGHEPVGDRQLTVYCGRRERANGRSAAVAAVELLRAHGILGATVFLGLDGTIRGIRRRARFFARNANVPLMIVAVGPGAAIIAALAELESLLDRPVVTLEHVEVLKRDGRPLARFAMSPAAEGGSIWEKLTISTGEQATVGGRPLYVELIRRLRGADGPGATALAGIWGYHGDHAPHGDRLLSLRRHVPVATSVIASPEEIARLWPIIDEVTAASGLVTRSAVWVPHGG